VNPSSLTWALPDRLRIHATGNDPAKPLFIGIARTEDVDRYLAQVEHDQVSDLHTDPFSVNYQRLTGSAPATLPDRLRFGERKRLAQPAARNQLAGKSRRRTQLSPPNNGFDRVGASDPPPPPLLPRPVRWSFV
jgi:hypothetical protein